MGKVRVKTLGLAELEEQEKKREKVKKDQKQARSASRRTAKGAHGGERVISMAPSEEELERLSVDQESQKPSGEASEQKTDKKKTATRKKRSLSASYKQALMLIDRGKTYSLKDGVALLKKASFTKFDGTVELHINVLEKGITGQITFPHATGKKIRTAIANDALIEDIEKGNIEFDLLLARPEMMGKLAKVARILGPRGLMPNPKSGTISDNPERLALSFAKGQVNFRTELQAPIIHLSIGKVSMKENELSDNINAVVSAIGPARIQNMTLKSTMSPGIKVAVL